MTTLNRWRWCTECGKWEDCSKPRSTHYAMFCSYEEPNERNFEGTAEELKRFRFARELRRIDDADFEKRIDAALEGERK